MSFRRISRRVFSFLAPSGGGWRKNIISILALGRPFPMQVAPQPRKKNETPKRSEQPKRFFNLSTYIIFDTDFFAGFER